MSDTPWGLTTLSREPCGLRECVLKVNYMEKHRAIYFARARKNTLLARVARWRLHDPEGFAQLLAAMNMDGLVKRHKS